ncbi:hypothetical protein C923_03778 [Plasmodium falciparum UGT5.1]|uniref:Uncharacterized protein n=1 Tax=Plasmodium falciparum UGT5.1 TaxID=1237627 RepID=W7JA69_PLAFA|nr:hypothetical protein C923_03778 [Plasmodium falciparum UGT5.1]
MDGAIELLPNVKNDHFLENKNLINEYNKLYMHRYYHINNHTTNNDNIYNDIICNNNYNISNIHTCNSNISNHTVLGCTSQRKSFNKYKFLLNLSKTLLSKKYLSINSSTRFEKKNVKNKDFKNKNSKNTIIKEKAKSYMLSLLNKKICNHLYEENKIKQSNEEKVKGPTENYDPIYNLKINNKNEDQEINEQNKSVLNTNKDAHKYVNHVNGKYLNNYNVSESMGDNTIILGVYNNTKDIKNYELKDKTKNESINFDMRNIQLCNADIEEGERVTDRNNTNDTNSNYSKKNEDIEDHKNDNNNDDNEDDNNDDGNYDDGNYDDGNNTCT